MDEPTLRAFHKKLCQKGLYQGLLNVNEDEPDINTMRENVKTCCGNNGYEKLKEIGPPESIIKEIESINNEPIIVEPEPEPPEAQEDQTKEKLIQELISINTFRKPGIGIPDQYRDRYGEILTLLNEKYEMSNLEIQKVAEISNKSVAKAIAIWKEKHPRIKIPDEKVVSKSEARVAQRLTEKVTDEADKTIESDMILAIHIRETYLKDAYMRGISLMDLVDTAIPIWFNIEGIYNTMLNMERENLTLKERVRAMEYDNSRLSGRNVRLNQMLINLNQFNTIIA